MASGFQSSFIPKEPITEEVFKKKKAGVFGILVVSLFVTSIIVAVSLYIYKGVVKGEIENLQTQLADAERNVDKKTINEMTQFSRKLDMVKSIVLKHKVVSNFLDFLSSSTVSTVQFTDFTYSDIEREKLMVSLSGKASDYASIALQENILSKNKHLKSIVFSGLSLTEKGSVSFDLDLLIDPKISIYSP